MEDNDKGTYIISTTHRIGDTIILDGYRYNCFSCVPAMQQVNNYQVWRYLERDSFKKRDNMAEIRTDQRVA